MALMCASYCERMPEINACEVARHYAFELGESLVPEHAKAAFIQTFGATIPLIPLLALPARIKKQGEFIVTESREPVVKLLNELLLLRESRRKTATTDAQRYGGLGGADFEGEPAAGKGAVITYMLVLHGYREIKIEPDKGPEETSMLTDMDKVFYRIPARMSLGDKKKWLLHIFDTGGIAVIDEINSAPMMEGLLNSLLMGKTPDNKRPKMPGFLILSTKNPLTMEGRRGVSTALARRFYNRIIPILPGNELRIILKQGVHPADILLRQELDYAANAYLFNLAYATIHHCSPAPTFRDIERIAKDIRLHPPVEENHRFVALEPVNILPQEAILPFSRDGLFQMTDTQKYLSAVRDVLCHYRDRDMSLGTGKVRCRSLLALLKSTMVDDHWKILGVAALINPRISINIRGEKLANFIYQRLGVGGLSYIRNAESKAADTISITTLTQLLKVETAILEQANNGRYELHIPLTNKQVLPATFIIDEENPFFSGNFRD